MNINLTNLMNLINNEESLAYEKYRDLVNNLVITKDRELDGTETVLNEVKDFDSLYNDYLSQVKKVGVYKSVLARYNTNTISETTKMSINEMINQVKALRKMSDLYDIILNEKPRLQRKFDGNGSQAYYRIQELNFDIEEIRKAKEKTNNLIMSLENEINILNSNTFVEL